MTRDEFKNVIDELYTTILELMNNLDNYELEDDYGNALNNIDDALLYIIDN